MIWPDANTLYDRHDGKASPTRVSSPVRQATGWVLPVNKLQKQPSSSDHWSIMVSANQIEKQISPAPPKRIREEVKQVDTVGPKSAILYCCWIKGEDQYQRGLHLNFRSIQLQLRYHLQDDDSHRQLS